MRRRLCLLLAAALLLLAGCQKAQPQQQRYQATFLTLFDTVTVIAGYADSQEEFSATSEHIYELLEEYHQLYDIYHAYSGLNNLYTVNHAGGEPVAVDARILDLLDFAREMYTLTSGKCCVTMGSVLSLWHDAREAGISDPAGAALPDEAALRDAAAHTDMDDMVLDFESGTVQLLDPELQLDVGAVAKGYACEQVCQQLMAEGLTGYVLNIGGNVRAIGANAGGTDWTVGLERPDGGDGYLCRLGIQDLAVVTSGSYQRYYTVDGVRYHHIIDPETLYPENEYLSVSVICPDSGLADALSTALFNLSFDDGLALVESQPGTQALWVFADGTQKSSSGFADFVLPED